MRALRTWNGTMELEGNITLTLQNGVELVYSEMEVSVRTQEADPSIGMPEHIDECILLEGKADIVSSDGEEMVIGIDLGKLDLIAPTSMETEFNEKLEQLAWENMEAHDDDQY